MFYFALNNKFKSAKLFSGKKNKFLIHRIIMTSVLFKKTRKIFTTNQLTLIFAKILFIL